MVERLQLGSVLQQPIETLSKGFRRRVGLAQAILHDPPVLILDEPTDGLDPNQKHEVRELIQTMAPGKVIVISTHILEEVDAVCTRAIIIAGGRIVADEKPATLDPPLPLPQRRHGPARAHGGPAAPWPPTCGPFPACGQVEVDEHEFSVTAFPAGRRQRADRHQRPGHASGAGPWSSCASRRGASTRCSAPSPRRRRPTRSS